VQAPDKFSTIASDTFVPSERKTPHNIKWNKPPCYKTKMFFWYTFF